MTTKLQKQINNEKDPTRKRELTKTVNNIFVELDEWRKLMNEIHEALKPNKSTD